MQREKNPQRNLTIGKLMQGLPSMKNFPAQLLEEPLLRSLGYKVKPWQQRMLAKEVNMLAASSGDSDTELHSRRIQEIISLMDESHYGSVVCAISLFQKPQDSEIMSTTIDLLQDRLDSWDQAPAPSELEKKMLQWQIRRASIKGDGERVAKLIRKRDHVPKEEPVSKKQQKLNDALFTASIKGRLRKVRRLITKGAEVNITNSRGETPLMHAIQNQHLSVVQLLVDHGADVNAKNIDQINPLAVAFINDRLDIAEFLIGVGADVNYANSAGNTHLTFAANRGHIRAVSLLLDYGADIDALDENGATPLIIASAQGHFPIVQFLIENHADRSIIDKSGRKAFMYATLCNHPEIAELLLTYWPDTVIKDALNKEWASGIISTKDSVAHLGVLAKQVTAYAAQYSQLGGDPANTQELLNDVYDGLERDWQSRSQIQVAAIRLEHAQRKLEEAQNPANGLDSKKK
jgi:ankyrin repeat protein